MYHTDYDFGNTNVNLALKTLEGHRLNANGS